MVKEKKHSEFPDWYAFKLEEDKLHKLPCIVCKKETTQYVSAIHILFKKMIMAYCCSEDCYKIYRKKYNV